MVEKWLAGGVNSLTLQKTPWGRILGRNWDKSLQSFPPCYSQSPLLTDLPPPPTPRLSKSCLKLVCKVILFPKTSSLRTLKIMARNLNELYDHEFGFWPPEHAYHCPQTPRSLIHFWRPQPRALPGRPGRPSPWRRTLPSPYSPGWPRHPKHIVTVTSFWRLDVWHKNLKGRWKSKTCLYKTVFRAGILGFFSS